MKILILGATGRTGKWLLQLALAQGFEVHCLARNVHRIKHQNRLTIYEGSPLSESDIEKACEGCEAIISALNISRTSDFPWAPLRTPKSFLSQTMKIVISTMKRLSIKRLVVCTAWGVSETRQELPFWFRWAIDYSNISIAYKDHEAQEKLIQSSGLEWTIVRPVGLTNGEKNQPIFESTDSHKKPRLTIHRKSLAQFMIDCLSKKEHIHHEIVISKA